MSAVARYVIRVLLYIHLDIIDDGPSPFKPLFYKGFFKAKGGKLPNPPVLMLSI